MTPTVVGQAPPEGGPPVIVASARNGRPAGRRVKASAGPEDPDSSQAETVLKASPMIEKPKAVKKKPKAMAKKPEVMAQKPEAAARRQNSSIE
ncbi:MAG: hypothetical protein AAF449_11780 [Myxococcota bacterium]